MGRRCAVAIGAALLGLALPRPARAQELSETLRLQLGYIGEARTPPSPYIDDLLLAALPEVSLAWGNGETGASLTYVMTGSLRTASGTTELSHQLTYLQATRLGRRTLLLLNASAIQSTFSNLLISNPLAQGVTGSVFPSTGFKFAGLNASTTIAHEISPLVLLTEQTDVSTLTTLAPTPPLDVLTAETGPTIERLFAQDAVGGQARISYVTARTVPPDVDRTYVFADFGPQWRRDWSRTISTQITGGVTALITKPQALYPSGRAAVLYTGATVSRGPGAPAMGVTGELYASTGLAPNPLTGLATRTHQAGLNVGVPISLTHQVLANGGFGADHSDLIDPNGTLPVSSFRSLYADAQVSWQITDVIQTYLRYQFIGQFADADAPFPGLLRDTVLLGLQLSSRPPNARAGVGQRVPQRVDGADAPASSFNDSSRQDDDAQDDWGRRNSGSGVTDGSQTRAPGSPPPLGLPDNSERR